MSHDIQLAPDYIDDPIPDPEPEVPSLPSPDPDVFHHDFTKIPTAPPTDEPA
jgi:hypothetical protein